MPEARTLRGMAWDHPRAIDPLSAISSRWTAENSIAVRWEARPLKAFEDQPLEELADSYDLVLMDYPFTGTAATSNLMLPVDDWAGEDYLRDQRMHSVGPSYASYTWGHRQWALAIDAACQVSAHREDLWRESAEGDLPDTWPDVVRLASGQGDNRPRIAMPLNPNHAYCAFVSVGLSIAGDEFWPFGECTDATAGVEALLFLSELAPHLHPASRNDDPIGISDRMSESDEIAFVPLMFGYSNYARQGFRRHRLKFGNAPRGSAGSRGSVLGGVGIALSACSNLTAEAANLARTIAAPEIQSGIYVASGGQPGHAAAWDSRAANAQVGEFFTATRDTIEQAFVRPRVPGHRPFQQEAGELIHRFIWTGGIGADECMRDYRRLFDRHLGNWGDLELASRPRQTGANGMNNGR